MFNSRFCTPLLSVVHRLTDVTVSLTVFVLMFLFFGRPTTSAFFFDAVTHWVIVEPFPVDHQVIIHHPCVVLWVCFRCSSKKGTSFFLTSRTPFRKVLPDEDGASFRSFTQFSFLLQDTLFVFEVCEAGYDRRLWVFSHSVTLSNWISSGIFSWCGSDPVPASHSPPTTRSRPGSVSAVL